MKEEIWLGNTVRIGSNTPRYLYHEGKDSIYFKTYKDHLELAFFDKKDGRLFFNSEYKMHFKTVKKQIIKDYAPKTVSQYFNIN